ncbi:uncharacterized protein METZ01_LOCUS267037 [marine metagenome]|uniref:Uncharacterized protein n=1 Tax=marine metagenome TaxID=408172 RepID=A0A382JSI2_9ZZZZ
MLRVSILGDPFIFFDSTEYPEAFEEFDEIFYKCQGDPIGPTDTHHPLVG